MHRFSENIKSLRTQKNLSLRSVADSLDMNAGRLAAIENGKQSATKDQALKLASILDANERDLLKVYLSDQVAKESIAGDTTHRSRNMQTELIQLQNRQIHFKMYKPSSPLLPFISTIICYQGDNKINSLERTLPDGNMQLVFDLNRSGTISGSDSTTPKIWVTGVQKLPSTVQLAGKSDILIVQFSPGGFYALTKTPPAEIKDPRTDAAFIFGRDISFLHEQMLELPRNKKNPFRLIEDFFHAMVHEQTKEHSIISYLTRNINTPLRQLVNRTGYSHKHIIQIFKKYAGMSPKTYHRICRFNKTLNDILCAGGQINWLDVAFKNGFYDQSHFIKEFRHFSGFSPQAYLDTGSSCSRLVHFNNSEVKNLQ